MSQEQRAISRRTHAQQADIDCDTALLDNPLRTMSRWWCSTARDDVQAARKGRLLLWSAMMDHMESHDRDGRQRATMLVDRVSPVTAMPFVHGGQGWRGVARRNTGGSRYQGDSI